MSHCAIRHQVSLTTVSETFYFLPNKESESHSSLTKSLFVKTRDTSPLFHPGQFIDITLALPRSYIDFLHSAFTRFC